MVAKLSSRVNSYNVEECCCSTPGVNGCFVFCLKRCSFIDSTGPWIVTQTGLCEVVILIHSVLGSVLTPSEPPLVHVSRPRSCDGSSTRNRGSRDDVFVVRTWSPPESSVCNLLVRVLL